MSEFFSKYLLPAFYRSLLMLPFVAVLMSIATFCFLGFSYALWTLGGGDYTWSQIGWYLLEVSRSLLIYSAPAHR